MWSAGVIQSSQKELRCNCRAGLYRLCTNARGFFNKSQMHVVQLNSSARIVNMYKFRLRPSLQQLKLVVTHTSKVLVYALRCIVVFDVMLREKSSSVMPMGI